MFLHLENVVQSMKKASPSKKQITRMGLVPRSGNDAAMHNLP